jgi:acetyl-CoA carboxylase biotin carboxyl carrier protein
MILTKKSPLPFAPMVRRPAAAASGPGLALGFLDLQVLMDKMGREPIDELLFESLGVKFRLRKTSGTGAAAPIPAQPRPTDAQVPPAPLEDPAIYHLTSPIVGTFHRAPGDGAGAYVQPGDQVKPGQILCVVEAMKLMHEIECDVAGEVAAVLAENGQPVEYGERLFAIRVR